MEKNNNTGIKSPNKDSNKRYLVTTLLIMFILPVLSIVVEYKIKHTPIDPALIGKWFAFWGIGVRLFTAGLMQVFNPMFTAVKIFRMKTRESLVIIRELGFGNISMGLIGIVSIFHNDWLQIAAMGGGLFFGMAALQHFIKKPDSSNEMIAMVTDLFMFVVMLLYLSFSLFF